MLSSSICKLIQSKYICRPITPTDPHPIYINKSQDEYILCIRCGHIVHYEQLDYHQQNNECLPK